MRLPEFFLSFVLLAIGWLVLHRLAVRRDRENSRRRFCIETRMLVEEIEKNSCCYHTGTERNIALEPMLKSDLNKLDARLSWLTIKMDIPSQLIIDFRQSVTQNNFETANFKKMSTVDPLVQNILLRSTRICEMLYRYELD